MKDLCIGTMVRNLSPAPLLEYLDFMASIGMECVQICRLADEYLKNGSGNENSIRFMEVLKERKIDPVSIFLFLPAGGLAAEPGKAGRMATACRQMAWGARYGVKYISCHVGNFPDPDTPEYLRFLTDLRELAKFAADLGEDFLFETGPETAEALERAINGIDCGNVGINFDPANLLIYNKTDPACFAERLYSRIRLIHCKDARRPVKDGEFGLETVLGEGDTNFFMLLESILKKGFRGPLVIEREIPVGEEHFRDMREACAKLQRTRAPFLGGM